ncbi:MAG: AbrB/MazE/SpoVT family DNA-binding domain-containing protein [Gloeomargarita sp. SKYG116]|nr:AbrB/MazE/SpoVT family DNA-binding domain-containing protein [Gloeomargarita sp. SKYG116]MDW8400191.1 AbrB/MazE/SpoVT family DNA-binding domain-containing protein [Gloeomargarita sp. SKYGB_i_bin116]
MRAKVQRWGRSLALRIPKTTAAQLRLAPKTLVDMRVANGSLVVTPLVQSDWTLAELLAGVTSENRHDEVDMGSPVGKEVW